VLGSKRSATERRVSRLTWSLTVGLIGLLAFLLVAACGSSGSDTGGNQLTGDSSCGDYLQLPESQRHDEALRLSSRLQVADAGNPNWAFTIDSACGQNPNRTLAEAFGQAPSTGPTDSPDTDSGLPECPFGDAAAHAPCDHPPYSIACYSNLTIHRDHKVRPVFVIDANLGIVDTDVPDSQQKTFMASGDESGDVWNARADAVLKAYSLTRTGAWGDGPQYGGDTCAPVQPI
jgi:hypothetical protein